VLTRTWNALEGLVGWVDFAGMTLTSMLSVLLIFVSVIRIGPFRTTLITNLEPLLSTPSSMALMGEVLTPVRAVGGVLMLFPCLPSKIIDGHGHD
jgi:drug/metabolite transporter (DMT)-like permease